MHLRYHPVFNAQNMTAAVSCFSRSIVSVAHSVHSPGNETPKAHRLLHAGGSSTSPHLGLCESLAGAHFYSQAAMSQPAADDRLFRCFWPASLWFGDRNTTSRHPHDSEPSHARAHTDGIASGHRIHVRTHTCIPHSCRTKAKVRTKAEG